MLVLDAETLAKHYVKGSINRKQFVSLSASLAKIEHIAHTKNIVSRLIRFIRCPKDLRNYSIKWRVKSAVRFMKYSFLVFCVLSIAVIWRVGADELYEMWHTGFDTTYFAELIIEGNPADLPNDVRSAMQFMSNSTQWERLHVKQFRKQWSRLEGHEKAIIQNTTWFHEFYLLAAIREVEQQKRLANGEIESVVDLQELHELVSVLS